MPPRATVDITQASSPSQSKQRGPRLPERWGHATDIVRVFAYIVFARCPFRTGQAAEFQDAVSLLSPHSVAGPVHDPCRLAHTSMLRNGTHVRRQGGGACTLPSRHHRHDINQLYMCYQILKPLSPSLELGEEIVQDA